MVEPGARVAFDGGVPINGVIIMSRYPVALALLLGTAPSCRRDAARWPAKEAPMTPSSSVLYHASKQGRIPRPLVQALSKTLMPPSRIPATRSRSACANCRPSHSNPSPPVRRSRGSEMSLHRPSLWLLAMAIALPAMAGPGEHGQTGRMGEPCPAGTAMGLALASATASTGCREGGNTAAGRAHLLCARRHFLPPAGEPTMWWSPPPQVLVVAETGLIPLDLDGRRYYVREGHYYLREARRALHRGAAASGAALNRTEEQDTSGGPAPFNTGFYPTRV